MFRNYIKLAWRNLTKDKTFTFINLFGLSVAFGVSILLCIYALFNLSYDQFHANSGRIYQTYMTHQTPKGPQVGTSQPVPFAGALKEEVPGVEKITRYTGNKDLVIHGDNQYNMVSAYVDPEFLSIFSFPVMKGDQENPIADKSTIALTRKAAKKIFGSEDVLGRSVNILKEGTEVPFTVAAILKDLPDQSSISFDILINFRNLPDFMYANNIDAWDKSNHEVFLLLSENMSPARFEESTRSFTDLHYREDIAAAKRDGAQADANGVMKQIRLLPFTDVAFAEFESGTVRTEKTLLYIVFGIALLILFIASVNFINLSIAKSAQRLREIGMRKTLGANKRQLFFQFWGESILIFSAAVFLGALLAGYLMEPFKNVFRTNASFATISSPIILAVFFLALLVITFIAGGYPALLLSKLGTLQALKGNFQAGGKNRVRNFLMVIQFGITILLISLTLVVWNQLDYMRTRDLGFNKEQVIAFPLNGQKSDQRAMQLLRNELQDKPGILSVSAANNILGLGKDGSRSTSVLGFEYEGRGVSTNMLVVDHDYIETLELDLVQGRSFNRKYASDSVAVVINEAMASELNEEQVLEKRLILDDSTAYTIVGVLENYHFQDLSRGIQPLTLFLNPDWNLRHAYIKVAPNHLSGSFDDVKNAWNKIEPQAEFLGSFLDENIDRTLRKERAMTTIISSGSVIAIILSCTGLFAISMLIVSQRRKEIGIRKVVGAGIARITLMLTLDFLRLVVLAFIIAAPIAWWLSKEWISYYAYRIDLSVWIFVAAGALAVFIALMTVCFQTIKAATANPVESLQSE